MSEMMLQVLLFSSCFLFSLSLLFLPFIGTNYCLFTYAEGSSPVICLHAVGEDGLGGLEATLSEDLVLFGGVRIQMGGSVKFYSFIRVGENVGGMKRGKAAMHKNAVLNVLEGVSGEISVTSKIKVFRY